MGTPQDGPTRKKVKNRRTKKLAKWREKQAAQPKAAAKGKADAGEGAAKKRPARATMPGVGAG